MEPLVDLSGDAEKIRELRLQLARRGLSTEGSKAQLIERLRQAQMQESSDEEQPNAGERTNEREKREREQQTAARDQEAAKAKVASKSAIEASALVAKNPVVAKPPNIESTVPKPMTAATGTANVALPTTLHGGSSLSKRSRSERSGTSRQADEHGKQMRGKLCVGKLGPNADEREVRALFAPYGDVLDVILARQPNGQAKGNGFVTYAALHHAEAAAMALNERLRVGGGTEYMTVKLSSNEEQLQQKHLKKQQSERRDRHHERDSSSSGSPKREREERTSISPQTSKQQVLLPPTLEGSAARVNFPSVLPPNIENLGVAVAAAPVPMTAQTMAFQQMIQQQQHQHHHPHQHFAAQMHNPQMQQYMQQQQYYNMLHMMFPQPGGMSFVPNVTSYAAVPPGYMHQQHPLPLFGHAAAVAAVNVPNTNMMYGAVPTTTSPVEHHHHHHHRHRDRNQHHRRRSSPTTSSSSSSSANHLASNNSSSSGAAAPNSTLFVKGFPADSTDESLQRLFSQFGHVHRASIHKKPSSNGEGSKQYAFIEYDNESDARSAMQALNGRVIGDASVGGSGSKLTVTFSTKK